MDKLFTSGKTTYYHFTKQYGGIHVLTVCCLCDFGILVSRPDQENLVVSKTVVRGKTLVPIRSGTSEVRPDQAGIVIEQSGSWALFSTPRPDSATCRCLEWAVRVSLPASCNRRRPTRPARTLTQSPPTPFSVKFKFLNIFSKFFYRYPPLDIHKNIG